MKKLLVLALLVGATAIGVGVVWLRAAAPGIDSVAATPAYIVINSPTSVVFTTRITDPSVISTGVNLLRTDSVGKTVSTAGTMRDDGQNGDVAANDRTFTLRFSINQATVGQLYYRVSAAFRGTLQRTLSPVFTVTIDPFPLPPDPGEAGKQTLAGIDSDDDGVRDDVQRYIAHSQPTNAAARAALRQLAVAQQEFILNAGSEKDVILAIVDRRSRAAGCKFFILGGETHTSNALRAKMLDTKARSLAFATADAKLSGMFFPLFPVRATSCDFDPLNPPR